MQITVDFNSLFPPEITEKILFLLDTRDLLQSIPLVCKQWNRISTNQRFWRNKCAVCCSCYLLPKNNLRYLQNICLKRPYGRNLINNPSGEKNLDHWQLSGLSHRNGDTFRVEYVPFGKDAEGFPVCFSTRCRPCHRLQTVDLLKKGCDPMILDTVKPIIECSEWHAHRNDCPSRYTLRCSLLNADHVLLVSKEITCNEITYDGRKWQKKVLEFTDYPEDVRYVVFESMGTDLSFWVGHYGPKMAKASVVLNL